MSGRARAGGAAALGAVLLAWPGGPAVAATPAPTPATTPRVVMGPVVTEPPARATVQDFRARVVPFTAGVQSMDGAVTDFGEREFSLASDVLFAFDEADLTPRAAQELRRIAGILREQAAAPDVPVREVAVTGHTSSEGTGAYNADLSRRRCRGSPSPRRAPARSSRSPRTRTRRAARGTAASRSSRTAPSRSGWTRA